MEAFCDLRNKDFSYSLSKQKITMNEFELSKFELTEIAKDESRGINGGLFWETVLVGFFVWESITNPESSYNSFMAGYEAGKNCI